MPKDPIAPDGWSIQSVKYHHDLVYFGMWVFDILSSLIPGVNTGLPTADVSYTLRRDADGTIKTIRLPGDHAAEALVKTMQLSEARPGAQ